MATTRWFGWAGITLGGAMLVGIGCATDDQPCAVSVPGEADHPGPCWVEVQELDEEGCATCFLWHYEYDRFGRERRRVRLEHDGRSTASWEHEYDDQGRRIRTFSQDEETLYVYDASDRILREEEYSRYVPTRREYLYEDERSQTVVTVEADEFMDGSVDEIHRRYYEGTSLTHTTCDGCAGIGDEVDGEVDLSCRYDARDGAWVRVCDGGVWERDGAADERLTIRLDAHGNPIAAERDGTTGPLSPQRADGRADQRWVYGYDCW